MKQAVAENSSRLSLLLSAKSFLNICGWGKLPYNLQKISLIFFFISKMPRAFLFSSKRYGSVRKSVSSYSEIASNPTEKLYPKFEPYSAPREVVSNLSEDLPCSQVVVSKQPVEKDGRSSLPVNAPPVLPIFDSAQVSAPYAHTSPSLEHRPRRKRLRPSAVPAMRASPSTAVGTTASKRPRPVRARRKTAKASEYLFKAYKDSTGLENVSVTKEEPEDQEVGSLHHSGSSESHFTCPECGKVYTTASNLTRHRQTHRSLSDQKARKCPHCDRVYVSSPAYNMHVQTHLQSCECPHCKKRFSRQWLLQGHLRTHSGERPFQCHKCDKQFADKSNLRAHIQTHSNEKPFICRVCQKAFALKSYLTKHEEASCNKNKNKTAAAR